MTLLAKAVDRLSNTPLAPLVAAGLVLAYWGPLILEAAWRVATGRLDDEAEGQR